MSLMRDVVMNVPFDDYSSEVLVHASPLVRPYGAVDNHGPAIVAQVFDIEEEHLHARVEHELRRLDALAIPGVVPLLGLEHGKGSLAVLREAVEAVNLSDFCRGTPQSTDTFLPIVRRLTEILVRLHDHGVIHGDLRPSKVLVSHDGGEVFLTGLVPAALLERDRDFEDLQRLAYISPERSGRSSRQVDARSDLYSLGVIIYELLCGVPPFVDAHAGELIRAHLVEPPPPPAVNRPDLPELLSRIVLKLLEKSPARRYQSAAGLLDDLERVKQQLDGCELDEGRELDSAACCGVLRSPRRLYGREREQALLIAEIEHATRRAKPRMILIEGPKGAGKSALADDIELEIVRRGGYLSRGRFEPWHSRLPYGGWTQALDGVLRQLLVGSHAEVERWRLRLEARLGRLATVLGQLLPGLTALLGELPPPPPCSGPRASRNRLQLALCRLLSALTDVGPLALILDDLHAADDSSIELLEALLDGGDCGAVLLIGTFQPGSQRTQLDLAALARRVESPGSSPRRMRGAHIELGPLDGQASAQIVRDSLGEEAPELAAALARKAAHNPGLLHALLAELVRSGALVWDEDHWRCSLGDALSELEFDGSLAGLLRARVEALPEPDAELLRRAACIGPAFGLIELEAATELERSELLDALSRLSTTGLLVDTGVEFRFATDSMREVAAASLSTSERGELHRRVGEAALASLAEQPTGAELDAAVGHLDAGLLEAGSLSEHAREQLLRLNLEAGRRSLELGAHGPALRCFELAAALVGAQANRVREHGSGEPGGALAFEIHFARAQALAMSDEHEVADAAFDELLRWRLSLPEYGRVVASRVQILASQERPAAATAIALAGLRHCGYELDGDPSTAAILRAASRTWLSYRRLSNEEILALPEASDPAACAAMTIANVTGAPAYDHNPELMVLLACLHAQLILDHGRHPSAPLAVAQAAMVITTVLHRTEEGARLSDCAMALATDVDLPGFARAEVVTYLIYHFTRPFADALESLERAYQRNLDAGEFEFVGYLASLDVSIRLELGTPLRTLVELCHRLERDLGNWGSQSMKILVRHRGALAAALVGDLDAGLGEIVLDKQHTPRVLPYDPAHLVEPSLMQLYTAKLARGVYHVVMGEHARGLEILGEIDDYDRVMMGSWSVPRAAMTHAVAAAACYGEASSSEQRRLRKLIKRKLAITESWAETCPANYGHHHDVVAAEHTLLRGDFYRAMELFEQARARAEQCNNCYVAALACERMVAHMRARGLATLAMGPLREAWLIYQRWGARAKLRQLERERSLSNAEALNPADAEQRGMPASVRLGDLELEIETVTTALAGISEELDPELLACKILEAAMSHADADHGALLVDSEDGPALAALGGSSTRVHALSPALSLEEAIEMLPMSLVDFVVRHAEAIVVDDARSDARFAHDTYVQRTGLRSLLGMQLRKRERLLGLLVLENRHRAASFSEERLTMLSVVATAACGALDNANLYRKLRRSEVQWRSLVDSAPDLIALFDAQGELSFVNRSLPGWVVGHPPTLDPNSLDGWTHAVQGALEHGRRGAVEIALVHSAAEDTLHWYDAHVAPLEIEGEARRVMVIAAEITERKQAEARRLQLESQLRQQQRLESLGTLASGVAHEINNPIQGILNYAELLGHSRERPELVDEFAAEITTEAERVATIVRSLLAFSRREATPEREPTAIAAVLDGTMSLIHSTLRNHQVELEVELEDDLPLVMCHSQQIQQIVMNLVTNARDAIVEHWPEDSPERRIWIRAQVHEDGERRLVRLSVIDRGGGIPEHVRAHIFDPFFTTKGRDQGTGLGLSVSHGIAQDHGGELWLETELGVGTRFHLDLPVCELECRE
jgi:PAS domain S-box-containing protein